MKRRNFIGLSTTALTGLVTKSSFSSLPRSGDTNEVSFSSLLQEMSEPLSLARWPRKGWQGRQASALQTGDRHNPGQFGNKAIGNFVRIEEKGNGQREWVLMEHIGPGAIVRMWAPNMARDAIFRIYFDGNTQPSIEVNMMAFFYGNDFVKSPFAALKARGGNVYLPIPFAKGCKITVDKNECDWAPPPDLFYIVQYRAYDKNVKVRTFNTGDYKRHSELLRKTAVALEPPKTTSSVSRILVGKSMGPGSSEEILLEAGGRAINYLSLKIEGRNIQDALRTTILKLTFDGKETVSCPVGDFFGSGSGLNPYGDWMRSVGKDGSMSCRWVMPYKDNARLQLVCEGKETVKADLSVGYQAWEWDERSMYFHCNWGFDRGINNLPTPNFNFISIKGRGVYVGDTLSITSYSPRWWGEGPEKVSIDGEEFPSQFGTGSEDYYGYAWGEREIFDAPFHAQPKIPEGPEFQGTTVNTRIRSLDAIPFISSLVLDMEVLTQGSMINEFTELDYGVATYWYGFADATGEWCYPQYTKK